MPPGKVPGAGDGTSGTETRGWFAGGGVGAVAGAVSVGGGTGTVGGAVGGTVEGGPVGASLWGAAAARKRFCTSTIGLRRIMLKDPDGATTHANTSMDTKRSETTTARCRIRTTSGIVEYAQVNRHSD